MATLNTAFSIATGALDADQAALDIVANNTANASTPGYTREVANWEENDSVTLNGTTYGDGAIVTGPVSQRDRVLEQSMQQQTQAESASGARLTALDQLQELFSDATSNTSSSNNTADGIGNDITQFFDSLSSLEASPSGNAARQGVLSAATTLSDDFNSVASQLSGQQQALDQQSSGIAGEVNTLTQNIAGLNLQIESTSPNSDAGVLEDQRQQDLTQLSQLIGFNQIQTEDNGLTLTTSSGALLVSGGQSYAITTGMKNGVTHFYDAANADITSDLTSGGGELGGILTTRDQDIPQAQHALDELAYSLASAVNTQNEAGTDLNGNAGTAIFSLPGTATAANPEGSAANLSVVMSDPSLVAAAVSGNGSSDNTNATAMANLASATIVGGDTATSYYSAFVTGLGSLVSEVSTENTAQNSSLTQLNNQIGSLSGVNQDEEAASLEAFEQSYQAASKIFTILDEVMVSALNLGVETSIS
ncbi:flagellar hook-associated protein FlgK [Paracidobacterium acidisoli]|uniref:Flagellar hook-associated protein 1 n=1 Tax=Paracidobacterium acidisoli TaxID=2303751 RepID=A0A372IRB2_9BACT|nr:flagellar hook-associated protein FlgK [Paracidobacterium acidisoli]MBT9330318.1 flagellar hook-associated protein FlgK [Paracidobacterium acidisoli]